MPTQTRNASPAALGEAGPPIATRILGGCRVTSGDRPLPNTAWLRRKAAGLPTLLALALGHTPARDEVLEALCPDLAPRAAAASAG